MARICLLDDDEVSLSVIAAQLRAEGHEVLERTQAIGTCAWVLEQNADYLVTDLSMPALRGERLVEILLARDATRVACVLMSSSRPADLDRVLDQPGVLGFVQKGLGNTGKSIHRLLTQTRA